MRKNGMIDESCRSCVLNRFIAVAAPDIVQGLGYRDLFLPVGGSYGEKRELGRGVRKIPKPHPHKPNPHSASAGLEEQFFKGPIEVEIPETQLGQTDSTRDLLLVGIPDHEARLALVGDSLLLEHAQVGAFGGAPRDRRNGA